MSNRQGLFISLQTLYLMQHVLQSEWKLSSGQIRGQPKLFNNFLPFFNW